MHQAAATSQSDTVSTKDFNSSVTPQIPAELAPWVTRAVHERRLLDRLPVVGVTASPSLEIIRHTSMTGAAVPTAEGAVKPGIVGYAAAGLGEISERAGMTKGALYHHFDSKEALATAIIEQGTNLTSDLFRHVCAVVTAAWLPGGPASIRSDTGP